MDALAILQHPMTAKVGKKLAGSIYRGMVEQDRVVKEHRELMEQCDRALRLLDEEDDGAECEDVLGEIASIRERHAAMARDTERRREAEADLRKKVSDLRAEVGDLGTVVSLLCSPTSPADRRDEELAEIRSALMSLTQTVATLAEAKAATSSPPAATPPAPPPGRDQELAEVRETLKSLTQSIAALAALASLAVPQELKATTNAGTATPTPVQEEAAPPTASTRRTRGRRPGLRTRARRSRGLLRDSEAPVECDAPPEAGATSARPAIPLPAAPSQPTSIALPAARGADECEATPVHAPPAAPDEGCGETLEVDVEAAPSQPEATAVAAAANAAQTPALRLVTSDGAADADDESWASPSALRLIEAEAEAEAKAKAKAKAETKTDTEASPGPVIEVPPIEVPERSTAAAPQIWASENAPAEVRLAEAPERRRAALAAVERGDFKTAAKHFGAVADAALLVFNEDAKTLDVGRILVAVLGGQAEALAVLRDPRAMIVAKSATGWAARVYRSSRCKETWEELTHACRVRATIAQRFGRVDDARGMSEQLLAFVKENPLLCSPTVKQEIIEIKMILKGQTGVAWPTK